MTTCRNCGQELLEGATFCGSCGSAVTPMAPDIIQQGQVVQDPQWQGQPNIQPSVNVGYSSGGQQYSNFYGNVPQTPQEDRYAQTPQPARARNLLVAVIAGVVVVVGIVVGIVVATSGRPSPVTAVNGMFSDLNSGNFGGFCSYMLLSQRSTCLSQLSSTGSMHPKLTYHVVKVAVDGDRAIVGAIGRECTLGQCTPFGSDSDPIPGLSKGFNAAFSEAVAASTSSSSSSGAIPCIFQNGHWYIDVPIA